jgi:hypothetical protein
MQVIWKVSEVCVVTGTVSADSTENPGLTAGGPGRPSGGPAWERTLRASRPAGALLSRSASL